jgi:urease accessory protein
MLAVAVALALFAAPAAQAHDRGVDLAASFERGFTHPITGPDHLIAMVAIGLLSAVLGGRAVLAVPAVFVGYLGLGGLCGFLGVELAGVELLILASLALLGLVLAAGEAPRRTLVVAVAGFGFAHGNAHGLELPLATSPVGYAGGFMLASALCHAAGILLAITAVRTRWGRAPVRFIGLATIGAAVFLSSSLLTG